jgi:hypothetical protein
MFTFAEIFLKSLTMSVQEQEQIKVKYYDEAIRYMDNAKETLKKAQKKDNYYQDIKYVKTACGAAYNGVLLALDGFFLMKGIENPEGKGKDRKSIEYYHKNLSKLDKKILNQLNVVYKVLHLLGYYDGIDKADILQSGFMDAYTIIDKIKPRE